MMKRIDRLNNNFSNDNLNSGAFDGSLFTLNIPLSEVASFGMNHS